MSDLSDLVAAARAGGGWAFGRLYEVLAPAVAGYLRGHGATEPEDLTSEVFLAAFTRIGGFEGDGPAFRAWLFTIAHHKLVDDLRRRGRRGSTSPYDPADDQRQVDSAEMVALTGLGTARVRRLLGDLAPDQRDVLLLRVVADLTVEQVALVVGKRPGAVKALQRRGLAALRRAAEAELGTGVEAGVVTRRGGGVPL